MLNNCAKITVLLLEKRYQFVQRIHMPLFYVIYVHMTVLLLWYSQMVPPFSVRPQMD